MTICYFGDYDPAYNRTRVLLAGLEKIGVSVLQCNTRTKGWQKYIELWKLHRLLRGKYDVLLVGYGDARLMPVFASLIGTAPTVWDPLYSLYDNWIFDRKLAPPLSVKALWYWILDWLGCAASDFIFLDTETNARYFSKTFRVPARKLGRVLVGADTRTFFPQERDTRSESFEVEFHGKYIPVQGTEVIIHAAKLLEHERVHFTMIGGGQAFPETKKLAETLHLANVTFLPVLPQTEVVGYIKNADVCIGLVGDVPRVVRAIPNKLYEAAAMARVSINADTSSLREIFVPGADVLGVRAGNAEELARAILKLKTDGNAGALGKAAYETFMRRATPELIAQSLIEIISKIAILRP